MKYLETCIVTTPEGLDDLGAKLIALDVPGYEVDDEEEFQTFLRENRQYWDYVSEELEREMAGKCQIKLYLPDDSQGHALLESVRRGLPELRAARPDLNFGSLEMTTLVRDEEDWQSAWKQYYKPLSVGRRLLIVPEWEQSDNPEGRVVFRSNPGMAFGTGTHASTRLCLELMEKSLSGGDQMLDLGCGSGILSIAGLLLGAGSALGVDIDQNAASVALENARLNHVEDRYETLWGDILGDEALQGRLVGARWDLITANIVADVIIALAPLALRLLRPGGVFIVSGVIDTREQEVAEVLKKNGFTLRETRREKGWCAMLLTL